MEKYFRSVVSSSSAFHKKVKLWLNLRLLLKNTMVLLQETFPMKDSHMLSLLMTGIGEVIMLYVDRAFCILSSLNVY